VKGISKRLGCRRGGAGDVKAHRFFRPVQWDRLLAKELPAPWRPQHPQPAGHVQF
jgi:protein kinase A